MNIWKFEFEITDVQEIKLPLNFAVAMVGNDPAGRPCMWLMLDPKDPLALQRVFVVGTGHPIPPQVRHLGSFMDGPFAWHVFMEAY